MGPQPLKAMVPVNVRGGGEEAALGNRISFAFVGLPLDVGERATRGWRASGARRPRSSATAARRARRPCSARSGCCPTRCAALAARAVASPRLFNLTISNVPGPDFPLYMLGAELVEAHPVVPIAQGHALSIGIFGYRGRLNFGFYADPHAFPEVAELPAPSTLHSESYSSLRGVQRKRGRSRRGRPLSSPSEAELAV